MDEIEVGTAVSVNCESLHITAGTVVGYDGDDFIIVEFDGQDYFCDPCDVYPI